MAPLKHTAHRRIIVSSLSHLLDFYPAPVRTLVADLATLIKSAAPGAREAVRVTGMGCTVPPGDPEALGRAVVDVVANREKYVKPRAEIEQAYNFQETIDRYERVFREAAARGR